MKLVYTLILLGLSFQIAKGQVTDENISQLPPQDKLEYGIIQGNLQTIKSAISKGADINSKEKTPLCKAITGANRTDEMNEAFVSMNGGVPPSRKSFIEIIHWLLQNGANPNIVPDNTTENPPLLIAAEYRDLEITKILLTFKANSNIQNQFGNNALHVLASAPMALALPYEKVPEIARLLISSGAKNTSNNEGYSPLALAKESLRLIENNDSWMSLPFYPNLINSFKSLIEIYSKF